MRVKEFREASISVVIGRPQRCNSVPESCRVEGARQMQALLLEAIGAYRGG